MADTTKPITAADVWALAEVLNIAVGHVKVARAVDDGDRIIYGTARRISGRYTDIRDASLDVTTREGLEVTWPISELASEYHNGLFAAYKW